MPLSPGAKLGNFEIVELIGRGGMGEVYRARDSRLKREVAIKVLPAELARDPDRVARFEREARAAGALNHPNIVAVYDIGREDDTYWIAAELVAGESLANAIRRGPLAVPKALEIATQIADGLSAAHAASIVHRDLKPANVMVTRDGRVKILDFGLALRRRTSQDSTTMDMTDEGAVMGTVGYMSPEQVRGETVDHRSDLFSFGVILYEMLGGKRAFAGASSVEVMHAILKEEPGELPASVPPACDRIVRRCLQKDRERRFQTALDLGFALESLSGASVRGSGTQARVPNRVSIVSLTCAFLLISAVAVAAYVLRSRPQLPEFKRITFRRGTISSARFAPDQGTIVFAASWDHPSSKLYRTRLDGSDLRELDIADSDIQAVSRKGDLAITSFAAGASRLARVPIGGGAPRELLEHVLSADWAPDGTQLAVARTESGESRLEYPVGRVIYQSTGWIAHVHISPRGDAIAFMEHPILGDDRGTLVVVDLTGKKRMVSSEWYGEQGLA
jgi:serine/threonine protein kinase